MPGCFTRPCARTRGQASSSMVRCISDPPADSIGLRQTEGPFGEIAENEIGRDRRNLIEPRFAEFALDVIFLGKSEAAMDLQTGFGGLPRRIRGEHLGGIGLDAWIIS